MATAFEILFSLQNRGIKLGLENTLLFLDKLGNPQKNIKAFHIAGSNGKGSTTSFVASILTEAGFKTGLYTSPHFIDFTERIRINGEKVRLDYVEGFVNNHLEYILDTGLTFFEVTTAMAFQYFAENKIDYAAIETGLGGRLDSTNVLNPIASIITTISLEHTNILGNSIAKIASEKAEIIKKGTPAFIGKLHTDAIGVIKEKCAASNSKLIYAENYFSITNDTLSYKSDTLSLEKIVIPLRGSFQYYNAGLAITAINHTLPEVDVAMVRKGIKNIVANTGISGRYELNGKNNNILLDSAHNPDGIDCFLKEFVKEIDAYDERNLIFSALDDKNIDDELSKLSLYFDRIFIYQIKNERALSSKVLQEKSEEYFEEVRVITNLPNFITFINAKNNKKEIFVVTGSMYLLGEVKAFL